MLKKAEITDIKLIAALHRSELKTEFLPSLGNKFLNKLYSHLFLRKNCTILVIKEQKKLLGFIVGSKNFSEDFYAIIKDHFIEYFLILIPQILLHPKIIINIFETFFYTKKQGDSPKAELVVIAVSKRYRRLGLGKKLVLGLENIFKQQNIKKYKVTVGASNEFYKALRFKNIHKFNFYNKKFYIYIKSIT